MIVCVCNNVSDKKIVEYIKKGASFKQLKEDLKVATQCGICCKTIVELIKEHKPKD